MTEKYTPEKAAELVERLRQIAESQRMDFDSPHVGMTLDESADALTAVSAERDLFKREQVRLAARCDEAQRALSRAEETIERVRLYCENQGDKFRYHAGRILDAITEHGKQKGADRG